MNALCFTTVPIPSGAIGRENPFPPFVKMWQTPNYTQFDPALPQEEYQYINYGIPPHTMPYAFQDNYGNCRHRREFKAAVLENNALRAIFLLEFGGRLWSLYDKKAGRELLHRNPGRKPVFLQIIEFCCDEHTSEEVAQLVEQAQAENRSVYTPQSLCSILERAGALVSRTEGPQASEEQGALSADEGADGQVEAGDAAAHPTTYWTSTDEGLTVLAAHREGSALEELLASDTESVYLPVYERVLAFCAQEPRTKPQIDAIVDDDPLVQKPRRYSNHFIELLENREALSWHDGGWNATELGRRYLEKHGIAAE